MKKIATSALLYAAVSAMPAYAADDDIAYVSLSPEMDAPNMSVNETRRFIVERIEKLSKFSLLQVNDNFSLYGKLSFPRIGHSNSEIHRNSATYGVHAQFDGTPGLGIRFAVDRYIAGPNAGDNLYSVTANFKF